MCSPSLFLLSLNTFVILTVTCICVFLECPVVDTVGIFGYTIQITTETYGFNQPATVYLTSVVEPEPESQPQLFALEEPEAEL